LYLQKKINRNQPETVEQPYTLLWTVSTLKDTSPDESAMLAKKNLFLQQYIFNPDCKFRDVRRLFPHLVRNSDGPWPDVHHRQRPPWQHKTLNVAGCRLLSPPVHENFQQHSQVVCTIFHGIIKSCPAGTSSAYVV
jgi:hypothetical protein